jgi:hypothetical protein
MKQQDIFKKATQLAANGEDFSILIGLLEPEYAMRLKIFVQDMPANLQEATVYGRANRLRKPIKRTELKRGDL